MTTALALIHSLSLTIWVGGMTVFSFILTPIFFKTFDKQQAGDIVGSVFPAYFTLGHVCSVLALGSYLWLRTQVETPWGDKARIALLVVMLAGAGINGLVIGPKSHEIKSQVRAAATEEARAPLQKEFGKLHGMSMAVNLLLILSGLALVVMGILFPLRG
ncbi:MAG: DUF4149 domain-containing protein [Chrysiogenetes bacterium]|nr:DUF4149 domain-containing protein [Chrysiogenetes bacterium]